MHSTRQPNFAALLGLAWLLVVLQLVAQYWTGTAHAFADTDDAMRLAQLRDWLGGQDWFDMRQPRVVGGYETHWSRLIDAGLGGMLWLLSWFAAPAFAERLMFTVWPLLWLFPAMGGTAAIAWRVAGREAALVALLMAVIGLPALHQFRPGRIDHHNVQIALSLLVLAATVWSDRARWAAAAAGAGTGLVLGVGLEALPYLAVCAAAFAARYVFDPKGAQAARDYGFALAASSVAAFLVTVAPDRWTRILCDAFALNWLVCIVTGALGLALAARFENDRMPVRLGCALLIGAAVAALAVSIEPRCLGGPYTVIDPAAWPIWLAHVRENKPLITVLIESPLTGIAIATFPAAALAAALVLARDTGRRHDFGFLVAAAAFAMAALTTLMAVRSASYPTWFGMPLVAAFALQLFAALRLERLAPRVAVGVLLTPAVLSLGAVTIANAAGIGREDHFHRAETPVCFENQSYAALAQLPAGVVATDVNYGPFVLALTPHSVLTAPYHRLATAIVAAHRAFAAPPEQARGMLAAFQAGYVAVCGAHAPDGLSPDERGASLWGRLRAGTVPDWLQPVPLPGPFAIYRVKP
jgi:hypothetical protein